MITGWVDTRFFAYNVTEHTAQEVADKLEAIIEASYRMEKLLHEF